MQKSRWESAYYYSFTNVKIGHQSGFRQVFAAQKRALQKLQMETPARAIRSLGKAVAMGMRDHHPARIDENIL
ncbi:hypothetical protein [Herbaspirillum camelliae]|uniref:hypothetical protein n=1 Tax=Herbaspirillum camelliae TaxID=1892903 RepID=UPI00117AFA33|nr:hypothetical protein [Herbaspirillum camelliae]